MDIKFHRFLKELAFYRKNKRLFKRINPFLKTGLYFYNKENKTFYLRQALDLLSFESKFTFFGVVVNKNKATKRWGGVKITQLLRHGVFINFHRKHCSPDIKGQIAIVSSVNSSIKVFDYSNKLIVTVFKDNVLCKKVIKAKSALKSAGFNVVNNVDVTFLDESMAFYQNCLFETIIKKEKFDHVAGFKYILKKIVDYQSSTFHNNELLFIDYNSFVNFLECNSIAYDLRQEFSSNPIPGRICHGDLHSLNVIYSKNVYYLIDFEMAGLYPFFFDALFYIFFEAYRFGDIKLLSLYASGFYDSCFKKLFCANDLSFNPSDKKCYLLLMLYYYYYVINHTKKLPNEVVDAVNFIWKR